jgi:hypothetical protein
MVYCLTLKGRICDALENGYERFKEEAGLAVCSIVIYGLLLPCVRCVIAADESSIARIEGLIKQV